MASNDSAFKLLVQYQPQQYVDRFFPFPGAVYAGMLPTELAREPLRADVLLRVRYPAEGGQYYGLHFEAQTKADKYIERRLCTYNLLAEEQYDDLVMLSTVVYFERCPTPTPPWQRFGPDGRVMHQFDYTVVKLWEIPVADWLSSGQVGLLPLVPFLKGATVADLEGVSEALEQIPDPLQRANTTYYTISFAKRVFTVPVVNDFLRRNKMIDTLIKESPFYSEIIELGREEGVVTGELQSIRATIMRFVQKRFPDLTAEAEKHLATISDIPTLEAMIDVIPYVPDAAAARAALGL
ncbi:MAG: hypothetical protein H0X24_12480 [Ktedonobacterales bacterium]|nr:hypothetical protein [Ktedonobacterales bacterium]